jgi:hypothetical protein
VVSQKRLTELRRPLTVIAAKDVASPQSGLRFKRESAWRAGRKRNADQILGKTTAGRIHSN